MLLIRLLPLQLASSAPLGLNLWRLIIHLPQLGRRRTGLNLCSKSDRQYNISKYAKFSFFLKKRNPALQPLQELQLNFSDRFTKESVEGLGNNWGFFPMQVSQWKGSFLWLQWGAVHVLLLEILSLVPAGVSWYLQGETASCCVKTNEGRMWESPGRLVSLSLLRRRSTRSVQLGWADRCCSRRLLSASSPRLLQTRFPPLTHLLSTFAASRSSKGLVELLGEIPALLSYLWVPTQLRTAVLVGGKWGLCSLC